MSPKGAKKSRQKIEPRESVTILHLSDLQFGPHHRFAGRDLMGMKNPYNSLFERLKDDLQVLQKEHDLRPDVLILTGDLTEWGLSKQFKAAHAFLRKLVRLLQLPPHRVAVVPGNHDVNRKACKEHFDKTITERGSAPALPWWPKWCYYKKRMFDEFYGHGRGAIFTAKQPWTLFEMPDLKVVVAGLNSTMAEGHDCPPSVDPRPRHVGYVSEPQLRWFAERLKKYREEGWLRIGAVHHNQQRGCGNTEENLEDQDARDLEQNLGSVLNLLLHGHTHEAALGWLGRNVPVVSTGSTALQAKERPEEIPNQYQIIQITATHLRIFKRCYLPRDKKWAADVRGTTNGLVRESVAFDSVFTALTPTPPVPPGREEKATALLAAYFAGLRRLPLISNSWNLDRAYHVRPSQLLRLAISVRAVPFPQGIPNRRRAGALPLTKFLHELIRGTSQVAALLGEAGIGKTTSCKWLRARLSRQPQGQIVPVYLALGDWQPDEPFDRFVDRQVWEGVERRTEHSGFSELKHAAAAAGCRLLLFLDGWNERPPEALLKVQQFIERVIDDGTTKIIVTSRPVLPADTEWLGKDVRFFELQRWTDRQLEQYFRDHGHPEMLARLPKHMQDCLRLPLLAFLLLNQPVHPTRITSVATATELLGLFVEQSLKSIRHGQRSRTLPALLKPVATQMPVLLQELAYRMTSAKVLQADMKLFRKCLPRTACSDWKAVLVHGVNSGLLRCTDPVLTAQAGVSRECRVAFLHQIFQEFLTAQYVLAHAPPRPRDGLPGSASTDVFWREVPVYLMEMLGANCRSSSRQKTFVASFLADAHDQDLLTAARLVPLIADPGVLREMEAAVLRQLRISLEAKTSYSYMIEAFRALGQKGLDAARAGLASWKMWVNVYAGPEAALLGHPQHPADEVLWRRIGRSIYLLGELGDFWLASQLWGWLPHIRSLHLLYHAGEAILTLARLPGRTAAQRTLLLRLGMLLKTIRLRDPVTEAYACAILCECGRTRGDARPLTQHLAKFLEEQADTAQPGFSDGFWRRAHGSEALAEVAAPEVCIAVLTKLFDVENAARYSGQTLGGYTKVHSSILKAVGRSCGLAQGNPANWRPLLEAAFRSRRVERNGWACNHLEKLLLRWFSRPEDLEWLRAWSRSKTLGGPRIRSVLANVLWTCE